MSTVQRTENSGLAEDWRQVVRSAGEGDGPDWMQAIRSRAAANFVQYGLPGNKDEAWKYTSLRRLENLNPALVTPDAAAADVKAESSDSAPCPNSDDFFADINQGFFLQAGKFRLLKDSQIKGVSLMPLAEAVGAAGLQKPPALRGLLENLDVKGRGLAFEALNTALLDEGVVIHVAAGVDAGSCRISWGQGSATSSQFHNYRVIVLLEEGSSLRLCEEFSGEKTAGPGGQARNIVLQASLGEGSNLKHIRVQHESGENILITSTGVQQAAQSNYRYTGIDVGGGLVRHRMACNLNGPGAHADLSGAFVLDGQRHVDNHICVDHTVAGCDSEQFFRGVLGGSSRGVWNGKAIIRAGADGTKVRQSNANLLLSNTAEIDTKPELEIYADEVEASHGATVGQLDENAVFYLRSRGLDEAEARKILTSAFCHTVTERLADTKLAGRLAELLDQSMPAFTATPAAGD